MLGLGQALVPDLAFAKVAGQELHQEVQCCLKALLPALEQELEKALAMAPRLSPLPGWAVG